MESKHNHSPIPSSSSSLFRDISNFRTPKQPPRNPNFSSPHPNFFTASKDTPRSSSTVRRRRPSLAPPSSSRSKFSRKLKAFELEQSKSARKVEIEKEKSLKSLAKSITVWLNFLLQSPSSCGCNVLKITGEGNIDKSDVKLGAGRGKRESPPGNVVGVETSWRNPKRQKSSASQSGITNDSNQLSNSKFLALQSSMGDICSFDDLKQRMAVYLSLASCKEIFNVMSHVTKCIDEGRLKMKAHCPIVTDVGLKEKALRILMCYNPVWLRIGLYIIFGGDSLLPNCEVNTEKEIAFLKTVVEKQLFSHAGLARKYAYNKLVEGVYRPGYYEVLGNVILKRFLLLVLILDRAKTQSCLPIKYGIDGLDGGSPLLFTLQSSIKSSSQMISDFLPSEVMHGEGNLLAHLVVVGYKVTYLQNPLNEYDFRVTEVFEDLCDGVRLCRVIHLLQSDTSILTKVYVPSDTYKKNLANCGLVLNQLKHGGVPLFDEDGSVISGEDIVCGDKELTLSLLWKIFIHLQVPLLINQMLLMKEIAKIEEVNVDHLESTSFMGMLLNWIQAICKRYEVRVDGFASLVDGKALWCLLDYYLCKELSCSCSLKDLKEKNMEASTISASDYTDGVHNFILSQKLTTLLGNFPEVLQISDIIEHNGACSSQSVVILLVFLCFQLIVTKNTVLIAKAQRGNILVPSSALCIQKLDRKSTNVGATVKMVREILRPSWLGGKKWLNETENLIRDLIPPPPRVAPESAAKIIQSYFRRSTKQKKYILMKKSASFLQIAVRAWLVAKSNSVINRFHISKLRESSSESFKQPEVLGQYITFMVDRHQFVKLKKAVPIIQRAARVWLFRRHCAKLEKARRAEEDRVNALQQKSASFIHRAWKKYLAQKAIYHVAATKIQSSYRGWLVRKTFLCQKEAMTKIQSIFRRWKCLRNFQHYKKATNSAVKIQSIFRRWKCLRNFQHYKKATNSAIKIQGCFRQWIARRRTHRLICAVAIIQSHTRGWFLRRKIQVQKQAVMKIQSSFRCLQLRRDFHGYRHAAIEIQRFVRGHISQRQLLGTSCHHQVVPMNSITTSPSQNLTPELSIVLPSVLRLQKWWRSVLLNRLRLRSAVIIQSHTRGWIARRGAARERYQIVLIQSRWKGYVARKHSRGKLVDLRLRMQKSAANVDDSRRLINKLLVALSELLSMKSVSNILHTCAILDMATEHSQKCCEKVVEAGAIKTLLKLMNSLGRSIPDQEVLKHALSSLRNLARYPHLLDVLIDSRNCMKTVLWEMLRNKEEAYFVAAELMVKMCSNPKGVKAARNLPALVKRLNNLVEEMSRKAGNEKRNTRGVTGKEQTTDKRLRAAMKLLNLITAG